MAGLLRPCNKMAFPCAYRSSATVEVPGGRDEQQRHSKDMAERSIVEPSSPRMISDYRFGQPYFALATSMEEGQSAGEHTISSGASCGPQDSTEIEHRHKNGAFALR